MRAARGNPTRKVIVDIAQSSTTLTCGPTRLHYHHHVLMPQECERDKLRLTLALQALRQAAAFRTFSWLQQGQGGEAAAAEEEALALLDPHYRPGHQCHHGHGHGHGHANQQQQQQQQQEEGSIGQAETASNGQAGEEAQADGSAGGIAQAAGGHGLGAQHDDAAACRVAAEQAGSGQAGVNGTADAGQAAAPPAHTHTHEAGACGACGSAGDAGPPEPTRREYEAAVKEAMQVGRRLTSMRTGSLQGGCRATWGCRAAVSQGARPS
mgnify:CR=1 FL=1